MTKSTDTIFEKLPNKDLLSIATLSGDDIRKIYRAATELKTRRAHHNDLMLGKRVAMIFEKDSLRTRFTFEVGIQDLGGSAVFMDHPDQRTAGLGHLPGFVKSVLARIGNGWRRDFGGECRSPVGQQPDEQHFKTNTV